jgi:adenosylcobinamide kinase/adenosylcobinamide-phosphate guanylyltransferase
LSLILVLGGARSGKSSFAEGLMAKYSPPVTYIATAEGRDEEMIQRIQRHRATRPPSWETVEAPLGLVDEIRKRQDRGVILVDCLTVYLSNLLLQEEMQALDAAEREERILLEVTTLGEVASKAKATVIVVANEVGWGLVPPYPLGREYRDLCGFANQRLAAYAQEVYLVVAGIPLSLKDLSLGR